MKRFLVSLFQYNFNPDPMQNFQTLERMFAIAGGRKSRFVLLPEMFACGFDYGLYEDFSSHAIDILKYLQQMALKYNLYLIAGSMPIKTNKNGKFFNRSYLISPEGAVIGYYDKCHIFFQNEEDGHFVSGKSTQVFQTNFDSIGIQICFDIRFPETIRELTRQGMKVLFVPAQFPNPRKDHWLTLLKARAIENQIYVVAANRIGEVDPELSYFGHSVIIDPYGEIIANGYEKEGVISGHIDLEFLNAYRKSFPVLDWL